MGTHFQPDQRELRMCHFEGLPAEIVWSINYNCYYYIRSGSCVCRSVILVGLWQKNTLIPVKTLPIVKVTQYKLE